MWLLPVQLPMLAHSWPRLLLARGSYLCMAYPRTLPSAADRPNLNGLFGRQSGTTSGYYYSTANKNMAVIWEESTLYDYLLNPKKYVPGTNMVFPRLKKPQERVDLITYLKASTAS
ncbi:hypothetical protein C4D60_Mb02t02910 [Musa balbisiana]|uniref:Cytochrome c domain-containing protein n=1 Tax=Musa balbisiana TaxID=52838 RepID=A0A4S8I984_MUSBA|nr:hypothetical protein C4D60_Mb02t02910 [Musa balbisiana]